MTTAVPHVQLNVSLHSRHSSLWEQKAGDSQWEDTVNGSDTGSDQSESEGSLCQEMLSLEEEPGRQEEEPATTPQYCFRPLREPPEEPAQTQAPAGGKGPRTLVQEAEEPGGSDDSGAEEVRGHLAVLQVPEIPRTPRDRRINLYAVMRSISEMDSPDAPTPLGGAAEGEVSGTASRHHGGGRKPQVVRSRAVGRCHAAGGGAGEEGLGPSRERAWVYQ